MSTPPAPDVVLRDVTLRDGLQDESPVPTDVKIAVFEAIVAAGIPELELTSFVRPDRVPAMADADAVCAATEANPVRRWGLVLNERGAQRALAAGLHHLQFVVSVSETHSLRNAGRPPGAALDELARVCDLAADAGAVVEVTLATAFGCPYEHEIAPAAVVEAAERSAAAGVTSIGLADTIGVAVPTEVRRLVADVGAAVGLPVGVHLHDTRGLGVANALAAVEVGVRRIDGSVGALGGCPFAPGASGNLALEDLAHALEAMGVATGVSVDGLVAAARIACEAVGRPVGSHVGVAGRRFADQPPVVDEPLP
ncbi:MAG TPA: hydroxymethylglutaryl-CoA lyase [Acidimicrobiales bacterium]|nr:hydroxymethylglutaryl-CoA lyase [Acidimicrobiales bacterium]